MREIALAALLLASLSGVARADVAPPLEPPESTIANKELVIQAFDKMFVDKKVDQYADTYFAPDFIEHDPGSTNGTAALKAYFKAFNAAHPNAITTVKQVIADGDLVLVHFHAQNDPSDRGVAGVDIFRVENGRIVEHWDVEQPIPAKSANAHPMF